MSVQLYTLSHGVSHLFFKFILFITLVCFCYSAQAKVQTLNCPDDLAVQLLPQECETPVPFDTLVWNSTEILTDTVFFPPSGTSFGIGSHVVTLAVTDTNGDLETCTFNVVVTEYLSNELECLSNVQLSLDGQCARDISPVEILFPDSMGCLENYEIVRLAQGGISFPPTISASDINSTFLVAVSHTTNGTQCLTQVTVTGGTPPSISCPPNAIISCNEPADTSITGIPELSGCFQSVELEYFDEKTNTSCPDSIAFQITRTWIGTDPFGKKDTCEQLITAYRFSIDLVDFPSDFDGVFNPPLQCSDSLTLEELTDPENTGRPNFINFPADNSPDCKVSATYNDNVTNFCGGNYEIVRVWSVVKLCAPVSTRRDTQYIQVIDTLGPIFDIPDTIFVSLSIECADSLILPSAENVRECSSFNAEIRTPWDTLTTNGGWTNVELSPGTHSVVYELVDQCGNTSVDSAVLIIESQTLDSCPPDVTVTCDYYFDTLLTAVILGESEVLNQLGTPNFHANCDFSFTETDSIIVDGCGNGSIFRLMVSSGALPQACLQEVHVEHVSNFEVIFPPDTSICMSLDSVDTGLPILSGANCENANFTFFDNVSSSGVLGCLTIERTWFVTNDCVFNGINTFDDIELGPLQFADGGDGVILYLQVIEVNNTTNQFFAEGCEIPDQYLPPGGCELSLSAPIPNLNGCGEMDLFIAGALGNEVGATVTLGTGLHGVNYTATDDCGRTATCNTFFEVIDTIPPEILCKTLLQVELLSVFPPAIEVFASDLIAFGNDNCGNVNYSFSPDSIVTVTTFFCEDDGINMVEVWGEDTSGNSASCTSSVVVQPPSPNSLCEPNEFLCTGTIYTPDVVPIANVNVIPPPQSPVNTNATGDYSLVVEEGADVNITPVKNTNPLNGVSTFDAFLITKHILNIEPLDSPYKLIAADFNNSGSITTFDLLEIRKLILTITTEIPNNTSWRFIPADFEFPNPQDPFSSGWPEVIMINNANADLLGLDFIGIKVGDVNGSADTQD